MTSDGRVVLDAAGGGVGGAARWAVELDGFLGTRNAPVTVVGRRRHLTGSWLAAREWLARGARLVVAPNNASFAVSGTHRRVLLRNALHFLYPAEEHLLARMPRAFRAQIPVVRHLLRRADVIVVPTSEMRDRVGHHVPSAHDRIAVRAHPVSPAGPRLAPRTPFILTPVLPAPYKNLVAQLDALLLATERAGRPVEVRVTARPADLPARLAAHPRLRAIGVLPYHDLSTQLRTATAIFYPSCLESFGYPLAEARVNGVPVLSPDSTRAREVAGGALHPYRLDDPDTLTAAVEHIADPAPEPCAFDRDAYFRWLFELSCDPAAHVPEEPDGLPT